MLKSKVPTYFWIIAVLALLWNLMGAFAFITDMMATPAVLAETYTPEQIKFLDTYPSWTKVFYGIATIGGLIACIGLLMRKRWALGFFCLSLLGVLIQQGHSIFMTNAREYFGDVAGLYMPIAITVIAILLILFTKSSISKHHVA